MWTIAGLELKKNLQDKGIWFWTFILPVVFIVGFVAIFSGGEDVDQTELITQIAPGYTVMFTFYIMISMVITFVKDRNSGMVARIASTPLPASRYFIGKWIPFLVLVMIQIVFLFAFGVVVYGLALGDPFALLTISLALSFVSTGWGIAMAVWVKSENMGIALTQIIALGGAMLGGLWMPIEFMPDAIQEISLFLPQSWALAGYKDIILSNGGLADIWGSLLVLIGYGLLGGLLALIGYPRFLRNSRG